MLARVNLRPFENVKVLRGDLFEALGSLEEEERKFDAVLTNPPYIPSAEVDRLEKHVKDYEPRMALDGGADGLDIVRRIIADVPKYLKPSGLFLMEIGDDQGAEVLSMALESGAFRQAFIVKDLQGRDRILKARSL